jgi:NACHT domain
MNAGRRAVASLRRNPDRPTGARDLRRLATQSPRWLAGLGVALLLSLAIALATVELPRSIAGVGDTFDNLLRNLITASVLGALAYLWFYFWTSARTTRHLLQAAQRAPERLFPDPLEPGFADLVFGRESLATEITESLQPRFHTGPQIVVGDTGAGKTTLLLALAAHLARENFVLPIVLNLRDRGNDIESVGFTELAIKRFHELIDPHIRTEAEADKLWRWMRRRGRVVVLADDLDRSSAAGSGDPYKTQIRFAIDAARRRNLPLVLTTRSAGLPPDLPEPPIDLAQWPLENTRAAGSYVLRRAGRPESDDEARRLVEENIEFGQLLENAFYLDPLARLLRAGILRPPPPGGRHRVRAALLDAERRRLRGDGVVDPAECERREQALQRVERLAVTLLAPGGGESDFEPRWLEAIRDGERFGLLSLDDLGHPQFRHEALHAYFAGRAIAAGDTTWVAALREAPNITRVHLALVLAAAHGQNADFCREACRELLDNSQAVTADQRLLGATAAAEVAQAGAFSECDEQIAARCTQSRSEAGPVVKRVALDQIEWLGGDTAVEALWTYSEDDDYEIRWRAVTKLVERCSRTVAHRGEPLRPPLGADAYRVLDPRMESALNAARPMLAKPESERPDDWAPAIAQLKQMAWMLPVLRTGAKDPALRAKIDERLRDLLDLEQGRVTLQRGLEASVAQGFKADARLYPEEPPDPYAIEMLRDRAVFWYSQLNLVHALAIRMAHDPDSGPEDLARLVAQVERREIEAERLRPDGTAMGGGLHPLLKAAADLCVEGLSGPSEERPQRVGRRVWDDESVIVSGRPTELSPRAAQLVGEITVLLNLNETGGFRQRQAFGEETTMPYCLQRSHDRKEFGRGCHETCGFRLCPFQPAHDRLSAHREISRAFCRDQRLNASRATARRWESRVSKRALTEFWQWLEAQARF